MQRAMSCLESFGSLVKSNVIGEVFGGREVKTATRMEEEKRFVAEVDETVRVRDCMHAGRQEDGYSRNQRRRK